MIIMFVMEMIMNYFIVQKEVNGDLWDGSLLKKIH